MDSSFRRMLMARRKKERRSSRRAEYGASCSHRVLPVSVSTIRIIGRVRISVIEPKSNPRFSLPVLVAHSYHLPRKARGASTLLRHSFNDALRSHGWNDSREPVIGGIEQATKLCSRPFPSSGHY